VERHCMGKICRGLDSTVGDSVIRWDIWHA